MSSFEYPHSGSSSAKPKAKLVKPILRKFTQSEKNSLDLNRPATEQGLGFYASEHGTGSRSVHDVSFQSTRRGYHNRTTSGASQFSTATAGSGRNGSFVHPFQQTPRPYTPPLAQSYQTSMLSERGERDLESRNLDDDELHTASSTRPQTFRTPSNLSNQSNSITESTSPTLPALRITTKNSSSSRLGLSQGNGASQSNLQSSFVTSPDDLISPTDTMSPLSTIRTSMDKGFRLRSRSENADMHANDRPDMSAIQEAKRKFAERERLKQEKAEIAEVKAIERANRKEARMYEKTGGRQSSKSISSTHEKGGEMFMARDYNAMAEGQQPPNLEEEYVPRKRRDTTSSTKKKSLSAWNTFIIWLRTRFLRAGRSARGN